MATSDRISAEFERSLGRYAAARGEGRAHADALWYAWGPMRGWRTSSGWSVRWHSQGDCWVDMQDDEDWAALGLVSVPADRMRDDLEPHVHVELHAYDAERRSTRAVAYAVPADAVTTQGRR